MSLRLVKEEAMLDDADKILFFLEKRNGTMPYSDDTPPAIIKSVFDISANPPLSAPWAAL